MIRHTDSCSDSTDSNADVAARIVKAAMSLSALVGPIIDGWRGWVVLLAASSGSSPRDISLCRLRLTKVFRTGRRYPAIVQDCEGETTCLNDETYCWVQRLAP